MDERELKAVLAAGGVKRVHIIANGDAFSVRADTPGGNFTIGTAKKFIRTWATADSAMKWLRKLGVGEARLDFSKWQPKQRGLGL